MYSVLIGEVEYENVPCTDSAGSSTKTSRLVIDASLAVWAVVPAIAPFDTLALIRRWREKNVQLISPSLFLSESTSAIRRLVHSGLISAEEGANALTDLLDLAVDIIQETDEHSRAAFRWAERLDQARAYDGFYLAVAEESGIELWTADERLACSAQNRNIDWIRWAGQIHSI